MKKLFFIIKKSLSATFVVMCAIFMLAMSSNNAKGQVYDTIYFDDCIYGQQVSTCPNAYDSTVIFAPAGVTLNYWNPGGYTSNPFIVASGFNGGITCNYVGGQKIIYLRPVSTLTTPTFTNGNFCGSITLDAGNYNQYGFITYAWSTGTTTQTITTYTSGTYTVTVSDVCGNSIIHSATLTENNPTPPNLGMDLMVCEGQSVTLNPGIGYTGYLWSTGATTSTLTVMTDGVYWVKTTNPGGCQDFDTVQVNFTISPTAEIGLVSIDTNPGSGQNKVMWDNALYPNAVSANIYRELTTNNYQLVGSASYGDGTWTDTITSINQPWRYKISFVDTCTNEGDQSLYVQSIHSWVTPVVTGGFNIQWTPYLTESKANVDQYNIYGGTSLSNVQFIVSVSGSVNQYTIPVFDDSLYLIGAVLSSKGVVGEAFSNPVTEDMTGIEDVGNTIFFGIYPNPTTNEITIQIENIKSVQLMDVTGRMLLVTDQKTINCSDLVSGVYFVKVFTSDGYGIQKFIKQ